MKANAKTKRRNSSSKKEIAPISVITEKKNSDLNKKLLLKTVNDALKAVNSFKERLLKDGVFNFNKKKSFEELTTCILNARKLITKLIDKKTITSSDKSIMIKCLEKCIVNAANLKV